MTSTILNKSVNISRGWSCECETAWVGQNGYPCKESEDEVTISEEIQNGMVCEVDEWTSAFIYYVILLHKYIELRPIYTRRYSGGIPRGIAHLSNQCTFIYFCVTPERYASGTALDRFQSDIPAGSRSPAVHLTNQRFCFAVVMPLFVTGLAGSDAYLGHQKTRCRRVYS